MSTYGSSKGCWLEAEEVPPATLLAGVVAATALQGVLVVLGAVQPLLLALGLTGLALRALLLGLPALAATGREVRLVGHCFLFRGRVTCKTYH